MAVRGYYWSDTRYRSGESKVTLIKLCSLIQILPDIFCMTVFRHIILTVSDGLS